MVSLGLFYLCYSKSDLYLCIWGAVSSLKCIHQIRINKKRTYIYIKYFSIRLQIE